MAKPKPIGQDSRAAWWRLAVSLVLATIGGVGLWSTVVVLPLIEREFGVDRGGASLPYTATMVGFAFGGVFMGRLADRFGIMRPVMLGAVILGLGYIAAAHATSYWMFVAIQAVLIGALGSSVTFGPMVADVSFWFRRHRGIAVAIAASGNYLAGAVWPPVLESAIAVWGWRDTYAVTGVFVMLTMIPLALFLRLRADLDAQNPPNAAILARTNLTPRTVKMLLLLAGVACCVAMSMPQVHIVAYCLDLGYGPARGAEMLSVMLGLGIVSRIGSGFIADRIGGLKTLILGSSLQGLALFFFLPFDGLVSLYLISALFGISQGGIVPSYSLIVRDVFPAREASRLVSLVLMATVMGMALGGSMSGEIYDLTGSYVAAFLNGIAWNALNLGIAVFLLIGTSSGMRPARG
ncbi:MAG: MFS transporter [Pseudomonadota bacterium]